MTKKLARDLDDGDGVSWTGVKVSEPGDYVIKVWVDQGTITAALLTWEDRWRTLESVEIETAALPRQDTD